MYLCACLGELVTMFPIVSTSYLKRFSFRRCLESELVIKFILQTFVINLVKSKEMIWLKGKCNVISALLLSAYSNNALISCYRYLLDMQNINYFFWKE